MKDILKIETLILILSLNACAPSIPKDIEDGLSKDPLASLPQDFPSYETPVKEDKSQKKNYSEKKASESWQSFFTDVHLKELIGYALDNNQEINILEQQILRAQNEVMARTGEYLPRMSLGGKAEVENVGEYSGAGITEKSSTLHRELTDMPENLVNRSVGLYASWEVDIWSKLRNSSKAAYQEYLATVEGKKFIQIRLISEIAHAYYELLAYDQQLLIVTEYIAILQRALDLVEAQQRAARVTSLAVSRFKAEVLKNEATQYELKQKIVETSNLINTLVGRFPEPIKREKFSLLENKATHVLKGVPRDLLSQRPDVRKAELELEAAKLDVKVAKARFYPSFSIEAGAGYESFNNKHFLTPDSVFYNLAGNLTAPLLNRQGIKADYFSANNYQIEKIYDYEKVLINAYTEVSNQLSKISNLENIFELKSDQVEALTESVEISGVLFKAARVDYVEALMTQRDFLEAQVELVEIKKEQLNSYIRLYQSLGGGWSEEIRD